MKNKRLFFISVFTVSILFAMLFPSLHAIKHIQEESDHKICAHQHNNKHEITHQHSHLDHCFVCSFSFTTFDIPQIQNSLLYKVANFTTLISDNTPYFAFFFKGSLFSLRAPPTI